MMFGGGFMQDMANKVKENLAMLPSRKPKYMEGRRPKYTYTQNGQKLKFKELSESELEEVICRIRLEAREESRKRKLILPVAILIFIVFLFVLDLFLRWILST